MTGVIPHEMSITLTKKICQLHAADFLQKHQQNINIWVKCITFITSEAKLFTINSKLNKSHSYF